MPESTCCREETVCTTPCDPYIELQDENERLRKTAVVLFKAFARGVFDGKVVRGEIPAAQAPMLTDEAARQFQINLE